MTPRLLRALGLATAAGLVVAALGALAVLKDRVTITVAREAARGERGPEPLDLLAEDLRETREALRAFSEATAQRLDALQELLERDAPAAAAAPASEPNGEVAPGERGKSTRLPPGSRRFLAFRLPSEGFAFDRPQRFVLVESLSRAGFDAKSTLHDFSGAATGVRGEFSCCLARPAEGARGEIVVDAAALRTGLDARDEEMRGVLDVGRHPTLRFEWTAFEPESVDPQTRVVTGLARGQIAIRGVARDVAMPVRVSVDESRRVAVEGQARVRLSAFEIPPPSKLGVISMEDEVVVWVSLRARCAGPATEAPARQSGG